MLFRIFISLLSAAVLGGAIYMSLNAVGTVSSDLQTQSVRTGSGGGVYIGGGRVK